MPYRRPVTRRARAAEIPDIDGYDKRSQFTMERLKKIKCEHAEREASRDASGPIRLISDPATPKVVRAASPEGLVEQIEETERQWGRR